MSGLLPINPADFPDVPTKKALIAIDLQNDFLAEDGALPVSQPDGMVDNIVKLAAAVRNSGYGEVVWVRSQFDTNRAVGEQQIIADDTPQLPPRPGASAAATAARAHPSRPSPPDPIPLEADPEAFLSIIDSGQTGTGEAKPQCVRKGTKGVELLPAIAAAKGPRDYAMTKTYYSAFQSGHLLHLLRRHFATELYICGALCNVSVYATALAASSYGFDITIVEDCCGYRSETRHLNARRKLTELTGCEYATAADIIPTLRPKPSADADSGRPSGTPRMRVPAQVPPELIAAVTAGRTRTPSRGGQGIPVRPRSPHSQAISPPPDARSPGEEGKREETPAALPLSPSPEDLSPQMEKLKLNAAESTGPVNVSLAAHEKPQPGPAQPPAEPAVQSVVRAKGAEAADGGLPPRANAQGRKPGPGLGQMQLKDMMAAIEASRHESKPADKTGVTRVQKNEPAATEVHKPKHLPAATPSPADSAAPTNPETPDTTEPTADFIPTEEVLMAETPGDILKGDWPIAHGRTDSPVSRPAQHSARKAEDSEGVSAPEGSTVKVSASKPTTSEPLCEGDTTLTSSFLPTSTLSGLFERLCTEVHFQKMMHQGGEVPRFVAVQGSVSPDGTHPVYRHPSDETLPCAPFTPAVQAIREEVEKQAGHEMNHVLIQCYRSGNDYISEHSDKTLDIVKGSYIANVSLGAERTMVFRTKRDASRKETTTPEKTPEAAAEKDDAAKNGGEESPETPTRSSTTTDTSSPSKRQTIRVPMPHNSLLKMGLATNAKWLHGIRPDKRPLPQRSADELAFGGYRISLTFRHIGTFLSPADGNPDAPLIWGQGAVAKARGGARPVVNGQTDQAIALLRAFGRENNSSEFGWEASYGGGFDVLHMKSAPRYFSCGDTMVDGRVRIALAELGIKHAHGSIGTGKTTGGASTTTTTTTTTTNNNNKNGELVVPVKFVVDDADRTVVTGDAAILLYLDARHPRKKGGEAEVARVYTRFQAALALGQRWKALCGSGSGSSGRPAAERRELVRALLRDDMDVFNTWLSEALGLVAGAGGSETGELFLAGGAEPSIADYAFWPILQDITEEWRRAEGCFEEAWVLREKYTVLEKYYVEFSGRKSVVSVFGEGVGALGPKGRRQGDVGKGVRCEDGRGRDADEAQRKSAEGGLRKGGSEEGKGAQSS